MRTIALALVLLSIVGCSGTDSDYYPYSMKGLGVIVSNSDTGESYYAGFVEGNYLERKDAAANCGSRAYIFAQDRHIQNYGYVCCTVTSESSCLTKVR